MCYGDAPERPRRRGEPTRVAHSWRLSVGMGSLAFTRRALVGLAGAFVVLAVMVIAAHADELSGVTEHATTLVIHDADETLARYCVSDSTGTLWLALPDGTRWELITSTQDPAIANPGDGSFHPFDASEVRAAIAGVRYPLGGIDAEVFILPYPRRAGLTSAAAPGLMLLSPGVLPVAVATQHATVTHELGHLVHFAHLPDTDAAAWSQWRALRGVTDVSLYCASAPHADRPHEIFAEDFRALYGDAQANYSGSIENASLAYPTQVGGLSAFVTSLSAAPIAASPLMLVSAPPHGAVTLARNGAGVAPLDLFDVLGRRVASVLPTADATGCHWTWDGHDASGARPAGAVLFARVRDGLGGAARLAIF